MTSSLTPALTTDNLLEGQFEPWTGEVLPVFDPADLERQIGAVPALQPADLGAVYEAAARGAGVWAATSGVRRGAILLTAAAAIRRRRDRLVEVIVAEMGKTLSEARAEVDKSAEFFEYYGGLGRRPFGELLSDARADTYVSVRHEPLGVVLLITPWNDPLLTPARKIAPALIAGNAVVVKPATETPLIMLELARILNDAGLPGGVLGTVTGRGSVIGDALLAHPALAAVSFTGSTTIGLGVQRALAGRQVRVQTEMGGKNAAVILADADLDQACDAVVAAAFAQAGQRCTATSRLIVVAEVAEEVQQRIVARVNALRMGPGSDPSTTLSPLISANQREQVTGYVQRALADGAEIIAGTDQLGTELSNGAFVPPLVLLVNREQEVWQEEVFGPVLSLLVVADEGEAIHAANDSVYGLSASVFTRDLGAAHRFIDQVNAGQIGVNQPTSGWDAHHPFGGFGDSGSPFKEQGTDALGFYTRVKTAAVRFQ